MTFVTLSVQVVEAIHDRVLKPGELSGKAIDKSLESALGRVENRLAYGMIDDVFDLAAAYAQAIARGHCFNDANKRTAYAAMVLSLELNGISPAFASEDVGPRIVALAQGALEPEVLAEWLRGMRND